MLDASRNLMRKRAVDGISKILVFSWRVHKGVAFLCIVLIILWQWGTLKSIVSLKAYLHIKAAECLIEVFAFLTNLANQ